MAIAKQPTIEERSQMRADGILCTLCLHLGLNHHGDHLPPKVEPCAICHEDVRLVDNTWSHLHGDVGCGTGDGSVAYPRSLYDIDEAARRARETADGETYEAIQVSGGKIHRPKVTTQPRMSWFKPMDTVCGRTVTPLNVYATVEDAVNRHRALCIQCGR